MATPRWKGEAVALYQITTIAVTGTWATNDTATITCNGKDLTVTIGAAVTIGDVVASIVNAVNASSASSAPFNNDETRNVGGQEIPEFTEFRATDSSPNIVLTAVNPGVPFTVSVSESTAGNGALGSPTNSVTATGPQHISNADNLSTGSTISNSDDLVFDSGDVSCLYDLDQNSVTLNSLTRRNGFTGDIGLPEINPLGYREYRTDYFKVSATTVEIGGGPGNGGGLFKLNVGSAACACTVTDGGTFLDDGTHAIKFLGTHSTNTMNVFRGTVSIAELAGQTSVIATLKVGYIDNPDGDAHVYCGTGVTLTNVDISGGDTTIQSATTTIDMDGGTLHILGGAHASIDCDGGLLDYRGTGTCTDCKLGGGARLDLSKDMRAKTFTTLVMNAGSELYDPFGVGVYTNGILLNRCTIDDVKINVGPNRTLTIA